MLQVAAVIVALVLHELAHAVVAFICGDTTAKDAGRITLNPAAHLDPFGSVILPMMCMIMGGGIVAFAKPVPYNPFNLKHRKRDEVLVALAGPVSNLIQALIAAIALGIVIVLVDVFVWYDTVGGDALIYFVSNYLVVNISLMLFNLIPLPPLDGSAVIFPLLSEKGQALYYNIQNKALPIFLLIVYILPSILNFDPIGLYIYGVGGMIINQLLQIAVVVQEILQPLLMGVM
ncbi:site-2 protease family protein [Atopobium fossor]|uniref:site-2 protease family protein n=1 Tax=Atopobium fossor TaxID=39487 RepID=UPI001B7FBF14|nr:site-2 protease family protein [Atopobium fossor]